MSAICWLRSAVVICARSGSILKSRSSGCDTTACSCAVTDGLKLDSELLAFDRSEFQPKLYGAAAPRQLLAEADVAGPVVGPRALVAEEDAVRRRLLHVALDAAGQRRQERGARLRQPLGADARLVAAGDEIGVVRGRHARDLVGRHPEHFTGLRARRAPAAGGPARRAGAAGGRRRPPRNQLPARRNSREKIRAFDRSSSSE